VISAQVTDQAGRPRNFLEVTAALIAPDLSVQEVELAQVGAGQYSARAPLGDPGTYMIRLSARDGEEALGQQVLGLVLPYSPEYLVVTYGDDAGDAPEDTVNRPLLEALARRTGGGELLDPLAAFVHNLPSADRAREAWRGLLLAAALLFPLDVALRRLAIGGRDLQRAWGTASQWVRARMPSRRAATTTGERTLGRLFAARQLGQARTARSLDPTGFWEPVGSKEPARSQAAQDTEEESPAESPDSLARLREAKHRARRR